MKFIDFVTEVEEGRECINESEYSNYTIRSLINNATQQLDCIKPSLQTIWNNINCCNQPVLATTTPKTPEQIEKEVETIADDPVMMTKYEKIVSAHAKAAVEYLKVLNKELKSIT